MTSRRVDIRDVYDDLLKGAGSQGQRVRTRIDQGAPINLYAARTLPHKNLVLEIGPIKKAYLPADFARPRIKGLIIRADTQKKSGNGELTLLLELQQPDAIDVFVTFVARVCEELEALAKPTDAVRAVLAVLERWKSFFSGSSELLTERRQTGLYGELHLINRLHKRGIPVDRLVSAWTGSQHTNQDFEFGNVSIEVKSTAAVDATSVSITNIRQLDDTGLDSLFLGRVVLDSRQGRSRTLPVLVGQLRAIIQSNAPELLLEFEEKVLLARYRDEHAEHYDNRTYTERDLVFYKVEEGFPRLTKNDLPPGIVGATYELTLETCEPFKLSIEDFFSTMRACCD